MRRVRAVKSFSEVQPFQCYGSVMRALFILASALLTTACIARTAVDLVTLPVRAVSAGVDALTTSDSERDQRRGRQLREEDERRGRAARQAEEEARETERGGDGNIAEPR